ncbi:MAG: sensor domain-containing diguanylate cyclase [Chloroflexi bacterium]|nr:sensor domain-containing diguanylate cyclase [Chloroflexota bacterium]
MDRSPGAAMLRAVTALLPGALAAAGVAMLAALPPLHPARAGLTALASGLAAVLLATSTVGATMLLTGGLRETRTPPILEAGALAALAAGAIGLLGGLPIAPALLASALMLLGASGAAPTIQFRTDRAARTFAAAVLAIVGVAAGIGLVPVVAGMAETISLGAAAIAVVALALSPARNGPTAALLAAGALGIGLDRGGSLESMVGLAALATVGVTALSPSVTGASPGSEERQLRAGDGLPALADHLADAVLQFDGRFRLIDWNPTAANLLGLDAGSRGARAEDLLGLPIRDLASGAESRRVVGGLEVTVHRSGEGATAIVRDPGARPEAERLGQELRATIEELLRARRTIDLQRGELARSATVDALTGLSSRTAIMERLRIEVAEARRYRHPLAVVMIDIDDLGQVNATHGQAAGDAVLREVGLRFRLRIRAADALGRLSGDEFIAALPHTDHAGAATFANALRLRLVGRPVAIADFEVPVSVSIGVSAMNPGEDLDLDGLLARVGEALDSARRAGGNRIALDRSHGLARLGDRTREDGADEPAV